MQKALKNYINVWTFEISISDTFQVVGWNPSFDWPDQRKWMMHHDTAHQLCFVQSRLLMCAKNVAKCATVKTAIDHDTTYPPLTKVRMVLTHIWGPIWGSFDLECRLFLSPFLTSNLGPFWLEPLTVFLPFSLLVMTLMHDPGCDHVYQAWYWPILPFLDKFRLVFFVFFLEKGAKTEAEFKAFPARFESPCKHWFNGISRLFWDTL